MNYINCQILGKTNFRTNLYHLKILVSENCRDIYKALNNLIESVQISEIFVRKFRYKNLASEILASENYGN